ncbi:bile acid:sodium symporter [Segatella albensis]|jgi:BASS family bile acid:Na+ symporter|uniref:bile acid:sodium symporter n=1 Tax=Segatella albensis TaxID=77768 RepID=UPI0004069CFF|nr:bile acid:sodium symporter [Segatella albensis]
MSIVKFLKDWSLLVGIVVGSLVYLLFTNVEFLVPIGDSCGPVLVSFLPVNIFFMLYLTFIKIKVHDMRPRKWHFILQMIRTSLAILAMIGCNLSGDTTMKLLWEGVFISVICPTAAAAPVITEKLGGNIASLTIYLLIANCFTIVIIPLLFPMVEKGANISFAFAAWMVMKRVLMVLGLPLFFALLSRKYLPCWVNWLKQFHNIGIYIWSFNLSIIMGITMRSLLHAPVSGWVLVALCAIPLVLSILQFSIGKAVGRYYGDSIGAGQALGQKNTVVGIWLTLSFLNPYATIAPCVYVIWQNIINALQLWYKGKYGYLKW